MTFFVNSSDTISQIKERVRQKINVDPQKQLIKYNEKKLDEGAKTLENYDVYSKEGNPAVLILETPNVADKNNIEIEKLSIIMNTNKDTKVNLTAKLFLFDDKKTLVGDYPLLCTNVEYDREYLETKQTFFEKVQVFFSQSEFEKFVIEPKREVISDDGEKNEIIKKNIMLMLEVLFPLSFPIKDDVSTISQQNNSSFDFEKMLFKVFRENQHVYLNIDRPSTVTQVIWLDTISSNPTYVQLYELIKKYKMNLISYVLEKFAKKPNENRFPFNEVIQKIEDILRSTSYTLEDTKGFKQFYKTFQSFRQKHNKTDANAKKSELTKIIGTLKKLLLEKANIRYDNDLNLLETSINTNEADDKSKITDIFESYKNGSLSDNDLRRNLQDYKNHGSTWWKLYFVFAGLKKNTSAYNTFVEEYVKRHVLQSSDDERRSYYYYNSHSSNESKFYKNLSDLKFHFEFMAKIEDFLSKKRKSLTREISDIFQESETYNRVQIDKYLSLYKRKETTNAGVDRVQQQTKSKDEEDKDKNETKQKFFEIQLGVALVGGKVPNAPSNFWCAFNSAKLANDYKFLTKYDVGEIQLYPYVDIEENPQADGKPTAEFGTILNLKEKKKGGSRMTRRRTDLKKKIISKGFSRKRGR